MSEADERRWAVLIVAITGGYQSGAGVSTEIVYGYPSEQAAKEAAERIEKGSVKTTVFPYFGGGDGPARRDARNSQSL